MCGCVFFVVFCVCVCFNLLNILILFQQIRSFIFTIIIIMIFYILQLEMQWLGLFSSVEVVGFRVGILNYLSKSVILNKMNLEYKMSIFLIFVFNYGLKKFTFYIFLNITLRDLVWIFVYTIHRLIFLYTV